MGMTNSPWSCKEILSLVVVSDSGVLCCGSKDMYLACDIDCPRSASVTDANEPRKKKTTWFHIAHTEKGNSPSIRSDQIQPVLNRDIKEGTS